MINGAERVRGSTVRQFNKRFAEFGPDYAAAHHLGDGRGDDGLRGLPRLRAAADRGCASTPTH